MKEHSFKTSLITIFVLISSPSISYSSTILLRRSPMHEPESKSFLTTNWDFDSSPIAYAMSNADGLLSDQSSMHTSLLDNSTPPPETSKPSLTQRISSKAKKVSSKMKKASAAVKHQWQHLKWYPTKTRSFKFFSKEKTPLFSQVTKMDGAFIPITLFSDEYVELRAAPVVRRLNQRFRKEAFTASAQLLLEDDLVKQVNRSLIKLKQLVINSSLAERRADQDAKTISQHFKSHLLYGERSIQIVTANLARIRSYQLKLDQAHIAERLGAELSALHGILGPDLVLADATKELLKEVQAEWNIPSAWDTDNFVKAIIDLTPHYHKLLTHSGSSDALEGSEGLSKEYGEALSEIRKIHNSLSEDLQRLNGPTLSQITDKLKQTELIQSFQMDMGNPASSAAHEVAFLEPFGIGRDSAHSLINQIDLKKIGLQHNEASIEALKTVPGPVKDNAVKRIQYASEALKIKEQLLKVFTLDGLNVFIRFFNEPEKVKY